MSLIVADGLTKTYTKGAVSVEALKDLTFTIDRASFVRGSPAAGVSASRNAPPWTCRASRAVGIVMRCSPSRRGRRGPLPPFRPRRTW